MMTTGKENRPNQKTVIERLLDDEQVLVHVNPAAAGLILPDHLKQNRTVTLRLSRYFKGDLFTDDEKVTADLLFGSEYFSCIIPWNSIWGASSIREEEFVWAEAAPEEILDLALTQQRQSPSKQLKTSEVASVKTKSQRAGASHLRRVK